MFKRNFSISIYVFFVIYSVAGLVQQLYGKESVEISGEYKLWTFNKHTSAIESPAQLQVAFSVTLCENTWKICATNLDDQDIWSQVVYDGTNTYISIPYDSHFKNNPRKGTNWVYTTISPGPIYYPSTSDDVALYLPWMTYCLSPKTIPVDKNGIVDIPLPWYIPRLQLCAYGYKWMVSPSSDDKFAKTIDIIRDTALDLDEDQELLRHEMDYPESIDDRNRHIEIMGVRMFIPNNFVVAHYSVNEFYITNDLAVPKKSECVFYTYSPNYSYPHYKIDLEANSIKLESDIQVENYVGSPVYVHDYRYKMSNNTRIFKYAEYTLKTGESWKSDRDPALLQQANDWLKHGRKYDDYGSLSWLYNISGKHKGVLALLLIVLVQIPFIVMLWSRWSKTQKKHNINNENI